MIRVRSLNRSLRFSLPVSVFMLFTLFFTASNAEAATALAYGYGENLAAGYSISSATKTTAAVTDSSYTSTGGGYGNTVNGITVTSDSTTIGVVLSSAAANNSVCGRTYTSGGVANAWSNVWTFPSPGTYRGVYSRPASFPKAEFAQGAGTSCTSPATPYATWISTAPSGGSEDKLVINVTAPSTHGEVYAWMKCNTANAWIGAVSSTSADAGAQTGTAITLTTECTANTTAGVWTSGGVSGGVTPVEFLFTDNASNPATAGNVWVHWYLTNPGAESCSIITDVQASYTSNTFALSFALSGTFPSAGVSVYFPDQGHNPVGSPSATVTSNMTVVGSPGYYRLSLTLTTTATQYRLITGTCQVIGTVRNDTTITPGATTYGATDGDTNTDCGWNPFCYIKSAIKWAFYPPANSTAGWQDAISQIQSKPPVSLITGGIQWVSTITGVFTGDQCYNHQGEQCVYSGQYGIVIPDHVPTNNTSSNDWSGPITYDSHYGTATFDPFAKMGDAMQNSSWGQSIYNISKFAIYTFLAFYVWNRISVSFGAKEETT